MTASDWDDESGQEPTGGQLRERLEQTLKQNKALESELVGLKASQVIEAEGLKFVKAEDLAGVPLADLSTKAKAIEAERQATRIEVLKDIYREQGVSEEQLTAAVAEFQGTKPGASAADFAALTRLGSVGGSTPPKVDVSQLHGMELAKWAMEQAAAKGH